MDRLLRKEFMNNDWSTIGCDVDNVLFCEDDVADIDVVGLTEA